MNDLDGVLAEFDRVIGLDRLRAIHINDGMFGLSSHKDRHAKIGEGKIGLEPLRASSTTRCCAACPSIWKRRTSCPATRRKLELLRSVYAE